MSLPATFMTAVCVTYIMMASEGLSLSSDIAYPAGVGAAVASMVFFLSRVRSQMNVRTAA
ncbi:MAG: hypothetical protein ACR2PT_08930 [Endozoicomonas sp.]